MLIKSKQKYSSKWAEIGVEWAGTDSLGSGWGRAPLLSHREAGFLLDSYRIEIYIVNFFKRMKKSISSKTNYNIITPKTFNFQIIYFIKEGHKIHQRLAKYHIF